MARKKSPGLGLPEVDHIASARHALDRVWLDIERMPATCEGAIALTARASDELGVARAHLNSVGGQLRVDNTKLYGLLNQASKALGETTAFLAHTCRAPGRAASERPTFSRARLESEQREREERERRAERRKERG